MLTRKYTSLIMIMICTWYSEYKLCIELIDMRVNKKPICVLARFLKQRLGVH